MFYYKTGNDTVDAILYIKQKIAEKSDIAFVINAVIPDRCIATLLDDKEYEKADSYVADMIKNKLDFEL